MIEIPAALISVLPPSPCLLLDLLRSEIDDELLWEIAVADYGYMADEMMAELRLIRDRGVIPTPVSGMLWEVLTLTHYSDPDTPNIPGGRPQPKGRRGHLNRLFACAVMLLSQAKSPHGVFLHSAWASSLISARALGEEMSEALASLLAWCVSQEETATDSLLYLSDSLVYALSLLILAIRLRLGRFTEPILGTIAEWVLALESLRNCSSLNIGYWELLAIELKTEIEEISDSDVRANLQLCALLLDTDSSW